VKPVWWPMFCQHMLNHIVLGQKCEKNIILVPSKKGFQCCKFGISDELWVAKMCFDVSL
jgi:hypothetical protein